MPLVAAFCCLMLALYSGHVYSETHTDVTYLVTNLWRVAGMILAGMVKTNVQSRQKKDEPTGSGKVSTDTEGQSSKDE